MNTADSSRRSFVNGIRIVDFRFPPMLRLRNSAMGLL